MPGRINGEDEVVFWLKYLAKEVQKQSDRQWKISIGVMAVTLLVAIAAIIIAI